MSGADGGVYAFGTAPYYGSVYTVSPGGESAETWLGGSVVGISATSGNGAYYLATNNGYVCAFGANDSVNVYYQGTWASRVDGCYSQGLGSVTDIVGISTMPNGNGYWIIEHNGTLHPYEASSYGYNNGSPPATDMVGVTSTSDGAGFDLVGADGGVFSYGDATYKGSLPGSGIHVTNVVGLAQATSLGGYWILGADGGVYCYTAPFEGSSGGQFTGSNTASAIAPTPDGYGYWVVRASVGLLFTYGDASFLGSTDNFSHAGPMIGIAA